MILIPVGHLFLSIASQTGNRKPGLCVFERRFYGKGAKESVGFEYHAVRFLIAVVQCMSP